MLSGWIVRQAREWVVVPHETIITAFKQHGFGNCTSIGVIKAAIETWGVTEIWQMQAVDGGSRFTLKNGRAVTLTNAEIELASSHAGFQLLEDTPTKRDITRCAVTCFAIICKVKQQLEEYGAYQEAIDDINDGEGATDAPRFLGLERFQEYIDYRTCFGVGGVVAHSVHHTVYVSHGDFDDYGEVNHLNSIRDWVRFARQMYRFHAD